MKKIQTHQSTSSDSTNSDNSNFDDSVSTAIGEHQNIKHIKINLEKTWIMREDQFLESIF